MMAWLLEMAPGFGFEVADHRLLVFGAKVYPWEIESILGVAAGFLQQVPGVVATLYPA